MIPLRNPSRTTVDQLFISRVQCNLVSLDDSPSWSLQDHCRPALREPCPVRPGILTSFPFVIPPGPLLTSSSWAVASATWHPYIIPLCNPSRATVDSLFMSRVQYDLVSLHQTSSSWAVSSATRYPYTIPFVIPQEPLLTSSSWAVSGATWYS